jgi:hypothetical protein
MYRTVVLVIAVTSLYRVLPTEQPPIGQCGATRIVFSGRRYKTLSGELCGDDRLAQSLLLLALHVMGFRSGPHCFEAGFHRMWCRPRKAVAALIFLATAARAQLDTSDFIHDRFCSIVVRKWSKAHGMPGRSLWLPPVPRKATIVK